MSIKINSLVKRFGKLTAVNGLSLQINKGQIYTLLGPNGAGKTTTIKIMVGLLLADGGEVHICECDIAREPEKAKSFIGYVPDEPYLYDKLTGREFLRFVSYIICLGIC